MHRFWSKLLQRTCLKPSHSLRRQLLLSFGVTALLSLTIVVLTGILCVVLAGNHLSRALSGPMKEHIFIQLVRNSHFEEHALTAYFHNIEGTVLLMAELVMDRFSGYPQPGWEDDLYVPFLDRETNRNVYPLKTQGLRLDWEIDSNVNETNAKEHVQERFVWVPKVPPVSTSNASYFMQGACDPSVTNESDLKYYGGCTRANNDITTGGVIQPSLTNHAIYEKASDIAKLLKPLYETQEEVILMGMYFQNSGAGSYVHFPGIVRDGSGPSYTSAGCEWMRSTNPRTNRSFGDDDQIARCHPPGATVRSREYNALERPWYRSMVENDHVTWYGPFFTLDDIETGLPLVLVGSSVFDRITGELIGVVAVEIALTDLEGLLKEQNSIATDLAIVKISDDVVIADTIDQDRELGLKVYESGLITKDLYFQIKKQVLDNSSCCEVNNTTQLNDPCCIQHNETRGVVSCCDRTYTVNLLPLPEPYETEYQPEFLVIQVASSDTLYAIENLQEEIDSEVFRTSMIALAFGCIGAAVVFGIIYYESHRLTKPLRWIELVSWRIVNHAEQESNEDITESSNGRGGPDEYWFPSPTVSDLVDEFKIMIHGFSGDGPAMVEHATLHELENQLTWQSDYHRLYKFDPDSDSIQTIKRALIRQNISSSAELTPEETRNAPAEDRLESRSTQEPLAKSVVLAPLKKNRGLNVKGNRKCPVDGDLNSRAKDRSPLFWRVLLLIALPMLLTNAAICTTVSVLILQSFPEFQQIAEDNLVDFQFEVMGLGTKLKAKEIGMAVRDVVRDTYFVARIVGWLLFDGIERSTGFTTVAEVADECKAFPMSDSSCPFFKDPMRAVCSCSWGDEDLYGVDFPCRNASSIDARLLQHLFFVAQSRDTDPETGERNASLSFGSLGIDDAANTTEWWSEIDIESLPGADKGPTASGFGTSYDRLRVSSAISIAIFPIINYPLHNRKQKEVLSQAVSFEADGMFVGFSGCSHEHAFAAHFQSTQENRAASIDPALCPLGKFGYDPRCRDWYTTGRAKYREESLSMHITAPFTLAVGNVSANAATASIANPSTGDYAGQTLFNFYPFSLLRSLDSINQQLSFVITPTNQTTAGGDVVVVGPKECGVPLESAWIGDILFPHEACFSQFRSTFETKILPRLKNGDSGYDELTRVGPDGSEQIFRFAFEPVQGRVLLPLDPSDYSRGVNVSHSHIYTIAIGCREDRVRHRWQNVSDHIDADLGRLTIALTLSIIGVSVITILVVYEPLKIAVHVTRPITTLLNIVRSINSGFVSEEIPPLHGGSREVSNVHNSFAKLYKTIQISNSAFFSGNLCWAYRSIVDALQLFRGIGDKKAIGIACNNLGNTLQSMLRDCRSEEGCIWLSDGCAISLAQKHYNEAVRIAKRELQEADTALEKSEYAQQLADRLFNRGLFLLTIGGYATCARSDAREKGVVDIKETYLLDKDVKDFLVDQDLLKSKSTEHFLRLLRRVEGLLEVYEVREVRKIWDINQLIKDADHLLAASWKDPSAPLFQEVSAVGRLQQLEAAAMKWDLRRGRLFDASTLAMRMFAEDEYLLEETFKQAASALLQLVQDRSAGDDSSWAPKTKASAKNDFRRMLRYAKTDFFDVGKCLVFAIEINEQWDGEELLLQVNKNCLALYEDACLQDDWVGITGYTVMGDMNLGLSQKSACGGLLRARLDLATSSTSETECSALPYALQMLVDSDATSTMDSYVLLVTDGFSWDSEGNETIRNQLERLNGERDTKIHVIILGVAIEDAAIVEECKEFCSDLSKASRFIEIGSSNIGSAFEQAQALICGGSSSRRVLAQGLTMETFSRRDKRRRKSMPVVGQCRLTEDCV